MKKLNFIYSLGIVEMRIMGFCYTAGYVFKNRKMPRRLSKKDVNRLHRHFKKAEKKSDTKMY